MSERRQERRREKVEVNLLVDKESESFTSRLLRTLRRGRASAPRGSGAGSGTGPEKK